MSKECGLCKTIKHLDSFNIFKYGKHGRASYCIPCMREYRKKRYHEYYKKNPEYKEKARARSSWYNFLNSIDPLKREKERLRSRDRYKKDPERANRFTSNWAKKYPWKAAEKVTRRRCAQKNATPPWVNTEDIKKIYSKVTKGFEVDHIVPLVGENVCGLHVPWNLRIISASENRRKSNKLLPYGDL